MAKRRKLQGRPLLLATTTVVMVIGCGGVIENEYPPPGNLMPPPEVTGELCIDVEPADAKVTVYGAHTIEWTERCDIVTAYGNVSIKAEAPGYVTETVNQYLDEEGVEAKVVLMAEPAPPPVGNLVAPPQRGK